MNNTTITKPVAPFDEYFIEDPNGTPPPCYKDPFKRKPVTVEEKVKHAQPALHRALKKSALDNFTRRW